MEYLTKKYPEKISSTVTVKPEKDSRLCTEMVTPVVNTHQETGEKSTPAVSDTSCSLPAAILERNAISIGEQCPEEPTPYELQLP